MVDGADGKLTAMKDSIIKLVMPIRENRSLLLRPARVVNLIYKLFDY